MIGTISVHLVHTYGPNCIDAHLLSSKVAPLNDRFRMPVDGPNLHPGACHGHRIRRRDAVFGKRHHECPHVCSAERFSACSLRICVPIGGTRVLPTVRHERGFAVHSVLLIQVNVSPPLLGM